MGLHFCVDFAVDFESLEGLKDGIVIISAWNEKLKKNLVNGILSR